MLSCERRRVDHPLVDLRELEQELGLEDELAVDGSRVRLRTESRRYGKQVTILEGFDTKLDLDALVRDLKNHVGAGGTAKDGHIELQGDHRRRVEEWLKGRGFHIA